MAIQKIEAFMYFEDGKPMLIGGEPSLFFNQQDALRMYQHYKDREGKIELKNVDVTFNQD